MIVIYPPDHYLHNPKFELYDGEKVENAESSERVDAILKALPPEVFIIKSFTKKMPFKILKSVHGLGYIKYLKDSPKLLGERTKFPSVFSKANKKYLKNNINNLGSYSTDTYTPLSKYTYQAALNAATCAYEAALKLNNSNHKVIYALCRPPGHHASYSYMGGYCYFNNAAIAAETLSSFGKVAILDLDFHHGNGTQDIFYRRDDVFYASIHADPREKYPYFSGYQDEKGEGPGRGFNLNIPLSIGATNTQYQEVLLKVLKRLKAFKPQYLVISFGGDTYEKDPIGAFKLTLDYYSKMGETVRSFFGIPTLIVQEGGYNVDELGKIVVNFITPFDIPS